MTGIPACFCPNFEIISAPGSLPFAKLKLLAMVPTDWTDFLSLANFRGGMPPKPGTLKRSLAGGQKCALKKRKIWDFWKIVRRYPQPCRYEVPVLCFFMFPAGKGTLTLHLCRSRGCISQVYSRNIFTAQERSGRKKIYKKNNDVGTAWHCLIYKQAISTYSSLYIITLFISADLCNTIEEDLCRRLHKHA